MSIPAAFLGVVLIWATTPLAIKWSSGGAGFLFSVASRMVLGVVICLVLVALLIAVPLYLLNWALLDGALPTELEPRTTLSIVYLAVFGSALGFILYYHVLLFQFRALRRLRAFGSQQTSQIRLAQA